MNNRLVFVVLLLTLVHKGYSLKCFACMSINNSDGFCEHPVPNTVMISDCNAVAGINHHCVTVSGITNENKPVVARSCMDSVLTCEALQEVAIEEGSVLSSCSSCITDLCNKYPIASQNENHIDV